MDRFGTVDREGGFTLIELLVVMLILGILASIALPLFISQKNNAYDAEAKATANSAQLAMEACGNDRNGYDLAACNLAGLHAIEPTLPTGPPLSVSPEGNGYKIDVEAKITGNVFSIDRLPAAVPSTPARSRAASGAAAR